MLGFYPKNGGGKQRDKQRENSKLSSGRSRQAITQHE
jgi:hypothetical protein